MRKRRRTGSRPTAIDASLIMANVPCFLVFQPNLDSLNSCIIFCEVTSDRTSLTGNQAEYLIM